jgi:nitrite reductase/ring-hydroxylating ferredoxin subunit
MVVEGSARPPATDMAHGFAGLPMPADKRLTLDPTTRPQVRRAPGPRFPFPVPNGWFIVARADELAPGDIRPVSYFARDLVVYRSASGTARVVDAYCAHLGANLAMGGAVEGDAIRCPFHGWCYDGATGQCTDIPYTEGDRVPSQARIGALPTLERNRMIWAWHHRGGGAPFYDVPVVPELDDPEWSEPVFREWEVASCCQEMAENNHDFAHFKYVHGTADIPWESAVIEGPYKRVEANGGSFVRETFGLGLGVLRSPGAFAFLSSTTPVDEEHLHVRWTFTTPRALGPDAATDVADQFLTGVSQDIPIWENKRYVERPVLTKEERGILDHREWCRQFYDG